MLAVWAADARFAAGQAAVRLAGQVDPQHVVYVGHGFGGAAAITACGTDPSCAGAASLDGTPLTPGGSSRPTLILGAEDGTATDPATQAFLAASTGPARAFTLDGAGHLGFTDFAAYHRVTPLPVGRLGHRALDITTDYLSAFLNTTTHDALWRPPTATEMRAAEMLGR